MFPRSRGSALRLVLLLAIAGSLTLLALERDNPPPGPDRDSPYSPGRLSVTTRDGYVRVQDIRSDVMGTRFGIEVIAPDRAGADAACRAAWRRIAGLERAMSTWIASSVLSRVNREAADHPVRVDADTFRVLEYAKREWKRTGGVFDPTVGPLIALWKPLSTLPAPPSDAEIAAARSRVGFSRVELSPADRTVRFDAPGMALDVGGIAKGYAAAAAAEVARDAGAVACRVNAGGDLYCLGAPPWHPEGFVVEIRDPAGSDDTPLSGWTFSLKDAAVATSGNYERYTRIGDERFSHIVDPRTGRPVPDAVAQVTVIAPRGEEADALATALTVLGPVDGKALAETIPGVEALFLVPEGEGYRPIATSGFPERTK